MQAQEWIICCLKLEMTLTLSTHVIFTANTLKPNNNRAVAKLEAVSQRSITSTLLNTESKSSLSSCYKHLWCSSHAGQRQFSGRSASEWPGVQCAGGGGFMLCFQKRPGSWPRHGVRDLPGAPITWTEWRVTTRTCSRGKAPPVSMEALGKNK